MNYHPDSARRQGSLQEVHSLLNGTEAASSPPMERTVDKSKPVVDRVSRSGEVTAARWKPASGFPRIMPAGNSHPREERVGKDVICLLGSLVVKRGEGDDQLDVAQRSSNAMTRICWQPGHAVNEESLQLPLFMPSIRASISASCWAGCSASVNGAFGGIDMPLACLRFSATSAPDGLG